MKLFLVRHGETDWNKELRYQGRRNTSLNATGLEHAQRAGETLKDYRPSKLFASDLTRTMQTAQIIGEAVGLQPEEEPRLREIHFGDWEGRTYPEVFQLYPKEVKMWREQPLETVIPGGETLKEVQDRVVEAIEEICNTASGDVVVVTHGGPIRLLLSYIGSHGAMWNYPVKPGSITIVRYLEGSFSLQDQIKWE